MKTQSKRALLIILYIILMLLPGILMLIVPRPQERTFWRELSLWLGFVGLSIAGMQFIPLARIPFIADVIDLDKMYKSHHLVSVLSGILIFLHPLILLLEDPTKIASFIPFTGNWLRVSGWISLFGFLLIILTSVLRKKIKLDYAAWLLLHDLFTVIIIVFGILHIFRRSSYTGIPVFKISWIILIAIWAGLTLYIRLIRPLLLLKKPYTLKKVVPEGKDTWSVYLEPQGHKGTPFRAGQVAWITIGRSPFVISKNPFSYSGSEEVTDLVRFSIKNLGNFTSTIGDAEEGQRVYVDGPYGIFNLADPHMKEGLVLLAGGIGIAPMMSILHTLADRKDQRPIYLFYGDQSEETLLFTGELNALTQRLNIRLVRSLEVCNNPELAYTGYISRELLEANLPENKNELFYFMCGPLPMMKAMERILKAMHIPHKQIETEKFEMA